MNKPPIHIKPFGSNAILVEWAEIVSETTLHSLLKFEKYINENFLEDGSWETVPAYNSLLLINRTNVVDFITMEKNLHSWYSNMHEVTLAENFLWKLPVCYEKEFAIDMEEVSQQLDLSRNDIIRLHTENEYTVYGLGFLPGFMYLGGLPKALEIPRRKNPRAKVAKGSVGIAAKQTGIYPQESPGGWNIIGSCSVPMFDVHRENPCFVSVGDKVSFYSISKAEYDLHKIEAEVGIYKPEKYSINA